jgi:hypothetical protein
VDSCPKKNSYEGNFGEEIFEILPVKETEILIMIFYWRIDANHFQLLSFKENEQGRKHGFR